MSKFISPSSLASSFKLTFVSVAVAVAVAVAVSVAVVLVGLVGLVFIFIYKKQYLHFYTSWFLVLKNSFSIVGKVRRTLQPPFKES